uniref:Cytochrome c oxidase subunit 2 n=1 Tax=Diaphanes nubilus TaxID=370596 RepID=A0A5C0PWR2_9COLE|nr:cytochrome c oxidase subunit 2 [Diaphanes nubilus]QEJ81528.1 cytochrome c oxidase subunit 2 [Diaphanes nubilus]
MSTWMHMETQNSISPLMEQLTFFHDHTMMIMMMITIMVLFIMISTMMNKYINRFLMEGQMIEMIWTILPASSLIFIALPSLQILYLMDEINSPNVSVKSIGHQWFWSYELLDFKEIEFDSYMIPNSEQKSYSFRLLDVDNKLIIPYNSLIRMIISSTDVIHSWTIPSAGVKIDATPGRLNQISFFSNRSGIFYGQCSEICGMNHSFMPIMIESVSPMNFIDWINN